MGFITYPQWTTELNRVGCFDGVFKASIFADGILPISQHSKKHFLNFFPNYPEERIDLIYPCPRFSEQTNIEKSKRLNHLNQNQFMLSV